MQPKPGSPVQLCWGHYLTLCLILGCTMVFVGAMLGSRSPYNPVTMLMYLLVLCIGPCRSRLQPINPACCLKTAEIFEDFEYFQDGDLIIGGLLTVNTYATYEDLPWETNHKVMCSKQLVEFRLAIEEINKNPSLLPNVTLGYHIYDSCGHALKTVRSTLQMLSGTKDFVPNYSCGRKRNIAGFIGDLTSETTIISAQILSLFGFSQVRGARHIVLTGWDCKLLKHFGWTWVGIIRLDDNSGETELQVLTDYLSRGGICVEFTMKLIYYRYRISYDQVYINWITATIQKSTTNIIVICGKLSLTVLKLLVQLRAELAEKTLILSPSASVMGTISNQIVAIFDGSLMFEPYPVYPGDTHEIIEFINSIHPSKDPEDKLLEDFLLVRFMCSTKDQYKNQFYGNVYGTYNTECSDRDITEALGRLYKTLLAALSPNVHLAVNIMSQAIHEMHTSLREQSPERDREAHRYQYQIPRAQCAESCQPGYRKALNPGIQPCCYGCLPCSEGEISNRTDSENCLRCPDIEWPNENKNQCLAKTEEFLSFYNDTISVFLLSMPILFFFITLLILGIFVIYRDSPIVRANNRSLSFLLLVSIKLSFLSVFLFLGRPVDITCMLRIITFGITFSIAVSSLLAKTIMVCVAFKATKPGSSWRKWLGVKLSNSVVLFCSSIQIIICMTWLAISPPFQELDIHTSPGTIIIQCNEGSAIGFYSVIGYMGLLAAVSFVLAFLARSLPDSFNEAKYITFSMLLFCSVWITMIPAYLSTKGKNTVCVEIFAILTSSAGLLACIFLPKCYIIMFRPEMNHKSCLLGSKT
uniref:G-protein coupled receptors family 3 profile domain-containing protein n=1 Tax=Xenopus tropicalis TaxID=8364 RepID=A0A1B8Y767_XENTR